MNESSVLWAVVPAAGFGQRMGSNVPKQYLPIGDKTVLEHTVLKLLSVETIEGVLVVLAPNDSRFATLSIAKHPKVSTIIGGAERSESVLAALNSLQKKIKLSDWVLVHDAARPCVTVNSINILIDTLKVHTVGGILGVPVSDTLKQVDNKHIIVATIDRQNLWQAQTPQMFRYGILRESLQLALSLGNEVTDEASALEMSNYQPMIVEGQRDNIKITHSEDLSLAKFILEKQKYAAQ